MIYTYKILNREGDISIYCNKMWTCIIPTDMAKEAGYDSSIDYFTAVFQEDKK